MKETVFDVLMYLFQHYMDDEHPLDPDRESLNEQLVAAGFPAAEVDKAFDWLEGLADNRLARDSAPEAALRVFSAAEQSRLDTASRGFLMHLEQSGVIDPTTRELILDRLMALDEEEIDIERLKWVTLMVLFNEPDQEETYDWIENMVFADEAAHLH